MRDPQPAPVPVASPLDPAALGEQIIENLRLVEQVATAARTWEAWWEVLDSDVYRHAGTHLAVHAALLENHGGLIRIADGVLVASEALVAEVFLDRDARYSVCGYADRMRRSSGRIYLGRDSGRKYDAEAARANAAIMSITKADAFSVAFASMKEAIATGEVEFRPLLDKALARICKAWFDLPDEVDVLTGSTWVATSFSTARCPGHYEMPSGAIFRPDPTASTAACGELQGRVLLAATLRFVTRVRGSGSVAGPVVKALFETFPDTKSGNRKLASALIGVMLGFVPTTKYNLLAVMAGWNSASIDAMDEDFQAQPPSTDLERAVASLEPELLKAIQRCPQPTAVWRRAAKDHVLGSSPHAIAVRKGEKIVTWIQGATLELAGNGDPSVFPAFGGDRRSAMPPRHACPGYDAAIGVMLGILAAMFSVPHVHYHWPFRPASS